jgi:hypothetical protein
MKYKELVAVLIICCAAGCGDKGNPVTSGNNTDPVIQAVTFMPDTIGLGESCLIEVKATDPENDNLKFKWETVGNISGSGSVVYFTPNACCGSPSVTITVDDGKGGTKDSLVIVPIKY